MNKIAEARKKAPLVEHCTSYVKYSVGGYHFKAGDYCPFCGKKHTEAIDEAPSM